MKREYHLKPFYRISYAFIAVEGSFLVFLKFQNRLFPGHFPWIWNIVATFFAIISIILAYNVFFEKLIISESGIVHRAFLQHFFVPWDQVESIPARFAFKILIARSSSKGIKQSGIPLYIFADKPIDSELGQQIKQYAPHLFVQENKNS